MAVVDRDWSIQEPTRLWNERLAAYLPQDRYHALATGTPLPERSEGAVLFADLSGFTPLAEGLTRHLGAHRGAEEVARQINAVYDALLPQVHRYQGSVIGFAGDAMTCYFDQDDARRATACALAMQAAMGAFQALPLPGEGALTLGLKVGVAAGAVRRFLVGDPQLQVLEVLAGTPLVQMAEAEALARRGEVLLEGGCARRLAELLQITGWRGEGVQRYAVVSALRAAVPPSPWPNLAPTSLAPEVLRPWLLPLVYERLRRGQGEFLTELRPVVALFMRFGGIDYAQDEAAGTKLDHFVRWVQKIVAEYEGTLLDLTLGDKGSYLYIACGAPLSHENDALRALRVAQALRRPPADLMFIDSIQVGLSQGTMRVGVGGGALRRTYAVLGDEANLAARLMEHAAAGEVLVSGRVHTAVGALAQWVARPPLRVKGKQELVPVFTLEELLTRPPLRLHEVRYTLPMVGRSEELHEIGTRLSQALLGRGQIVALIGEAGIGKSRLVAEVIQQAEERGMVVCGGACQSHGTNSAYLLWQPIWRTLFGLEEEVIAEEQPAVLSEALARLDPALLPRLPLLAEVVGIPLPDNDLTHAFDPAQRKQAREAFLVDCLKILVHRTPLLLVLEDIHWLDPLSHDLLEVIGQAIWNLPVLVLTAYRPPELPRLQAPRVSSLPHFSEVTLTHLPPHEAERLLRTRWTEQGQGRALSEEIVRQVLSRTHGNPFYLEELIAYLLAQSEGGQATLTWPASLESLILSRLDQLSETERVMLKVASIIGRRFPAIWLWGYYPALGGEETVRGTLAALTPTTLIQEDTPEPGLTYLFRHILTQEVTYASLPHAMRAQLHEQVAHYLEAQPGHGVTLDLLAYHFERSENLAKKREYLRRAGEAAQATYANAAAQEYYERLLPLLDEPEEQIDILLKSGAVLELIGQWEAAEQRYLEALALAAQAREESALARSEQALGILHREQGGYETAQRWLEQARARWERMENRAGLSAVLAERGIAAWRQTSYPLARAALKESLRLCREQADLRGQAYALNHLGIVACLQGVYEEARTLLEESAALSQALGDKEGISRARFNLALVAHYQGEQGAARALYEEFLLFAREQGNKWAIALALQNLGYVAWVDGEHEEAHALWEEALTLRRALGDRWGLTMSLYALGLAAEQQGAYGAAHALHEESLRLSQEIGIKQQSTLYTLLGMAAVAQAGGTAAGGLRAACLMAALHSRLLETGHTLHPIAQAPYHELLATLRAHLSDEAFAAAWTEGEVMTLEEAVAYALEREHPL